MTSSLDVELTGRLLGDRGVGKTALAERICEGSFTPAVHVPTTRHAIKLPSKYCNGFFMDSPGDYEFSNTSFHKLDTCEYLLLCYDVTNSKSLETALSYLKIDLAPNCFVVLVALKADADKSLRQVSTMEGLIAAKKHGISFAEVSSKDDPASVETLFRSILDAAGKVNAAGKMDASETNFYLGVNTSTAFQQVPAGFADVSSKY